MTTAPPRVRLIELSPDQMADRLNAGLSIYAQAMGYPRGTIRQRAPLWLEHTRRPGWRGVAALKHRREMGHPHGMEPSDEMVGIAYGYIGAPGQWWHEEVRRGLLERHGNQLDWFRDYFELTELHVLPRAQGGGLGELMLRVLVAGADRPAVLLSTPELDPDRPSRAWRLYRRLGFVDVLREHRFVGDPRPFAVLGARLPLPPAPDGAR